MLDTRLILIEGPPGSGKTTTAQKLASAVTQTGKPCQCYYEWNPDHPIAIGDDFHLSQVISTSRAREADMLRQWQAFTQANSAQETVTVMESRFWQTSVMLLYAAGFSQEEVIASNQCVIEAIQALNPVLIYYVIDDLRDFSLQVIESKNKEWQQAGIESTWVQHVYDAFEDQPWFVERGLSELEGMVAFFEEWAQVAEQLYARLPFPKIKVRNPHLNRTLAMQQMCRFLDLTE